MRQGGYRDGFFLKLVAAARHEDPDVLRSVLTTQRAHLLAELRSLHDLRRDGGLDHVVDLLITAAELHVKADLELIAAAEESPPKAHSRPARRAKTAPRADTA